MDESLSDSSPPLFQRQSLSQQSPKEKSMQRVCSASTALSPPSQSSAFPSHRSATSSAALPLASCAGPEEQYFSVSGELAKNVAFVRKYKPVAELEAELFALCRDYESLLMDRGVTLVCVTSMFPMTQVMDRGESTVRMHDEVETLILNQPWKLADYHWIERAVHFINLLSMKWELVNPSLYSYRNTPVPSNPVLLHQYKLRQVWVFTMETIWFACAATKKPLRNRLPRETVDLACQFQAKTLELIRFVASLNFGMNYKLYPSVSHNLGLLNEEERLHFTQKLPSQPPPHLTNLSAMGKFIQKDEDLGEVVKAMGQSTLVRGALRMAARTDHGRETEEMRQIKSKEVGFHLLELPSVLLSCLEREAFRENVKLQEQLKAYEKLYRVLDCLMVHRLVNHTPVQPVNSESGRRSTQIHCEALIIPEEHEEKWEK